MNVRRILKNAEVAPKSTRGCGGALIAKIARYNIAIVFLRLCFCDHKSSIYEVRLVRLLRLSFQMCCSRTSICTANIAFIAIFIPISLSLSEFTSFVLLALPTFAFCICFVYKRSPRSIIKFFEQIFVLFWNDRPVKS